MTTFQRRQSLVFDNYEQAVLPTKDEEPTIPDNNGKVSNVGKADSVSIDDLDMMSLSTSFDKQMLLGSPMYLDPVEDDKKHTMVMEEYSKHGSHSSQPVPSDASNLHLEGLSVDANPFESVVELRTKYILASSQDCKSNIKYDLHKWFLYPKPLPKFWKFAHDKRLQDSNSSVEDVTEDWHQKGYYFPTISEDEYVKEEKLGVPKRLGNVHYTGEFFELDHYKEEFENHKRAYCSRPLACDFDRIPSFDEFRKDFEFVIETIQFHPLSQIAQRRRQYLLDKFELFQHLNSKAEILENKRVPLRDFYNARKVDRDLLLNSCATQRQLSEFIWEKLNLEPNRAVYQSADGEKITLSQIFEKGCSEDEPVAIGLKIIDDEFLEWYRDVYLITLHLIPTKSAENFLKHKELRFYLLAKTFLEIDNYMDGEYLAEIFIKYCVHTLEKSKYQLAQISVDFQFFAAKETSWWIKFSHWVIKWKLISHNIRWNVQISRAYTKLFGLGRIKNFQEFLDLVFEPLFSHKNMKNIELQFLLSNVCCIDLVVSQTDDYLWKEFTDINTQPKDWAAQGDNPTISHYMYYIYANLSKLNCIRQSKYLNTISLRNYCSRLANRTSQAGTTFNVTDQVESLVCNLLLSEAGLLQVESLWDSPPMLPYLFYLCQIPVVVAPLSSVSIISSQASQRELWSILGDESHKATRDITEGEQHTYTGNPFMDMFKIGMKVSLSSRSVLFNSSYTLEPLIEEYSVAASIYLLNAADLCEFSRTSVLCSGYEGFYKAHWIGVGVKRTPFFQDNVGYVDTWYDREVDTSERHNVPSIRRIYRKETLDQEWGFIREQFGES